MKQSIAIALLMLVQFTNCAVADDVNMRLRQGEALASKMCGRCHAIGRSGQSPHIGAPAFRTLDERLDLDSFMQRLQTGLTSGHPDMPTFKFSRNDARMLIAYLRSIQGP
jgi:cytochrome c553